MGVGQLIAVVATTPYIALQLQSVVLAFGVFATLPADGGAAPDATQTAFWVAVGLALLCLQFLAEIWLVATHRQHPFGLAPDERL